MYIIFGMDPYDELIGIAPGPWPGSEEDIEGLETAPQKEGGDKKE